MKKFAPLLFGVLIAVALTACTPTTTTVVPVEVAEQVTTLPFEEAFRQVTSAINSQPYPSDSGGWIITSSDQVGGFISAELNGRRSVLFTGMVPYRAFVSVALVSRGDGTTAVNISVNTEEESKKLADSIRGRLGL